MLNTNDMERIGAVRDMNLGIASDAAIKNEVGWLCDQLLKADTFAKGLLEEIYLLRQLLKKVL